MGFINIEVRGERAQIKHLFVWEGARKKGSGSKLLENAISFLKDVGVKKITTTGNELSKGLLIKSGFTITKEFKNFINFELKS